MDWMKLAGDLAGAAKTVATLIPGAQNAVAAVEIGKKLVDLIDDVSSKAPETRGHGELQVARKQLRDAVSEKAQRTADRLDG